MRKQLKHQEGYNYRFKVYKNGKMVSTAITNKFKRFFRWVEANKFLNFNDNGRVTVKVYVKILYPYKLSCIRAYNDATCDNQKDLISIVRAFTEK